jgi:hypothetical protein
MTIHSFMRALNSLAICSLLWGCSGLSPVTPAADNRATATQIPADVASGAADLASAYAPLRAGPGRVVQLDPAASRIRVYAFRGGRAGNLGHNHVLSAPQFEGLAYLPEQGLAGARLDLLFRLDQLVLDVPAQRAEAGAAFASVPSDAAIAATRANMLGDDNLQAARYPLVRIRTLALSGEAPRVAARVAIELHGQTHEMDVPVNLTGWPEALNVSGALVLRQSDFGIRPFSVMNGLLAVQDELRLEFTLVSKPE